MPKLITNTGTPISLSGATYVVGVARPTASYLYLADGTKVQAIGETGQGYEYLGSYSCTFSRLGIARANTALPSAYRKSSLRLSVNGSNADIESFPFAGGRIVKTTNGYEPQYYITDHLGSTRTVVKPNATVVAEFDYMPYGTLHSVATAPITEADYKYTGKEQQTAFGLDNLYDSQARFQYVRDGSFMSHDPLSATFSDTSPYMYCGGDPINRVDQDGRKFTPLLSHYVDRLNKRIDKVIKRNNAIIKKLTDKGKGDNARATRLRENNEELDTAQIEILILDCSDQLYDINLNAGIPYGGSPDMEYFGWLTYNKNNEAVTVNLAGGYNHKTLLHELKHGFQFEDQTLSLDENGFVGGIYYDYGDEVEAHRRGSALDDSKEQANKDDYKKLLNDMSKIAGKIDRSKINHDIWNKNTNTLIELFDL